MNNSDQIKSFESDIYDLKDYLSLIKANKLAAVFAPLFLTFIAIIYLAFFSNDEFYQSYAILPQGAEADTVSNNELTTLFGSQVGGNGDFVVQKSLFIRNLNSTRTINNFFDQNNTLFNRFATAINIKPVVTDNSLSNATIYQVIEFLNQNMIVDEEDGEVILISMTNPNRAVLTELMNELIRLSDMQTKEILLKRANQNIESLTKALNQNRNDEILRSFFSERLGKELIAKGLLERTDTLLVDIIDISPTARMPKDYFLISFLIFGSSFFMIVSLLVFIRRTK
jgi:hypothetical protein